MTAQLDFGFADPRVQRVQQQRAELESQATVTLVMYVASGARYAVADQAGEPLAVGRPGGGFGWHHADEIAIRAAVKVAARTRMNRGLPAIRLIAKTSAVGFQWINRVGTNDDDGKGGKTRQVATAALEQGVLLSVERLSGGEANPATKLVEAGFADGDQWVA